MGVINKIIGTHSERELKRHKHTLDKVLALKPEMEKLTDDEMRAKTEEFKKAVTQFNGNFSSKNTFHFRTELVGEQDYYDFASNLCEFVDNDKISDYQKHISERYTDIIRRISQ